MTLSRAWCVAEIAEADKSHIPQRLKVLSVENIDENFEKVETLDVRECGASRPEDKQFILDKIEKYTTIDAFNTDLRVLVGGIAFRWLREENHRLTKELHSLRENQKLISL